MSSLMLTLRMAGWELVDAVGWFLYFTYKKIALVTSSQRIALVTSSQRIAFVTSSQRIALVTSSQRIALVTSSQRIALVIYVCKQIVGSHILPF